MTLWSVGEECEHLRDSRYDVGIEELLPGDAERALEDREADELVAADAPGDGGSVDPEVIRRARGGEVGVPRQVIAGGWLGSGRGGALRRSSSRLSPRNPAAGDSSTRQVRRGRWKKTSSMVSFAGVVSSHSAAIAFQAARESDGGAEGRVRRKAIASGEAGGTGSGSAGRRRSSRALDTSCRCSRSRKAPELETARTASSSTAAGDASSQSASGRRSAAAGRSVSNQGVRSPSESSKSLTLAMACGSTATRARSGPAPAGPTRPAATAAAITPAWVVGPDLESGMWGASLYGAVPSHNSANSASRAMVARR